MPKPGRVGLLTGTFDPIHLGHVAMARAAMAVCGLDEVWVLVNPDPGHKQDVTGYAQRWEMARMALVGEEHIRLDDPSGLNLTGHNWAQFRLLMAKYPAVEFYFIVGADVLDSWEYWQDAGAMAVSARFLVARRGGSLGRQLDSRLRAEWFESREWPEVSSGRIRRALAEGKTPVGLNRDVAGYIEEYGLYTI